MTDRIRKYNKIWESEHPWLMLKDGLCFCKLCHCTISQFKKHNLMQHEKSAKHKKKELTVPKSWPGDGCVSSPNLNKELEVLQQYGEECGQDLKYSTVEETALDSGFLLLDNSSLQPLKTPSVGAKRSPEKEQKGIPIQNKKEPASKKTKLYNMKSNEQMSQQSNAFQSTPDEFESFGFIVAAHLRSLSTTNALESQCDMLQYLVNKRLGRNPTFVTNPDYV